MSEPICWVWSTAPNGGATNPFRIMQIARIFYAGGTIALFVFTEGTEWRQVALFLQTVLT